ncbi:mitogen-activated protein kinase kinase kinase 20-like [Cucumis melo]|uniref:Mitogen-activated protein kinase kinase kinase 20-like n=1 Tax=Cucumis melo TaxID=3656 RepID=A0A1S3CFZ6_CUCME|nr:mitogen-activated protein kinase kinase kinase 20-like [Cucumis melo]
MKRNPMLEKEAAQVEEGSTEFNNGIQWKRGRLIGKGSFGSVFLACLKPHFTKYSIFPPVMAVKSAEISVSETLQKEKQNYDNLKGCNSLIQCFGEEITTDHNGRMTYNLLLEVATGGTLAHHIKNTGGKGLEENVVRNYTKSIIKGLIHIHRSQYVHCDLKPANILLLPKNNTTKDRQFIAKIADLGLARRTSKTKASYCLGGTFSYMAPETLIDGVQESTSDIWALGCVVLEMLTGNRAWAATDKVGIVQEMTENFLGMPKIPEGLSAEATGFLKNCLVRKPEFRFTAEMLINVPFVAAAEDQEQDFNTVKAPTFVTKWPRQFKRQRIIPIKAV